MTTKHKPATTPIQKRYALDALDDTSPTQKNWPAAAHKRGGEREGAQNAAADQKHKNTTPIHNHLVV